MTAHKHDRAVGMTEGLAGVVAGYARCMVEAVVRQWDDDEGWGVLDAPETPGGCWTHYSHVEMDGYRRLVPGHRVDLDWESFGQDGYDFRAVRVVPQP